jgi:hypothetical protein
MDWQEVYILVAIYGNISIVLLFFSLFLKEKYKNIFNISVLFLLSFVVSLRNFNVALDTPKYVELFLSNNYHKFYEEGVYDIGYILLNKFIHVFTNNYHIFLFLITFIQLLILYQLYKNLMKKLYPLGLLMYISTFVFWLSNLSMLRQGLAIPIMALGIYYLIFTNQTKRFFVLSILSSTIHYSSIFLTLFIYLMFLFFKKINISSLKIIGILLFILIIYPKNVFLSIVLDIVSYFSSYIYSSPAINKFVWYFNWNKLVLWHVKHVYYLILLLFFSSIFLERNKIKLLVILIPMSFLGLLKYDEMVTDRIFMYFILFIPFITYKLLSKLISMKTILFLVILFG